MTHVISGENCLGAWKNACSHLLSATGHETFNLIVTIKNSHQFDPIWVTTYNPKREGGNDVRDVINTLFPMRLAARAQKREDLYAAYMKAHLQRSKLSAKKRDQWGTYFQRLICFAPTADVRKIFSNQRELSQIKQKLRANSELNQLDQVIEKLGSWSKTSKAALYCHTSAIDLDSFRTRGGPCLQFLEFLQPDKDHIDLLAVYRNQDYFNKALGNFIALGQLLSFVCNNVNKSPGEIVCHAAHASLEGYGAKTRRLIGSGQP